MIVIKHTYMMMIMSRKSIWCMYVSQQSQYVKVNLDRLQQQEKKETILVAVHTYVQICCTIVLDMQRKTTAL